MMLKYKQRLAKIRLASLGRAAMVALVSSSIAVVVVAAVPFTAPSGGLARAATSTTATISASHAANPKTTTTSVPSTHVASQAPIAADPSRSECLTPPDTGNGEYGLPYLQSIVASFDTETDSTVTCLSAYLTGAQTWSQWVDPWVTNAPDGYTTWVAEEPQSRQLVLAMNLIPASIGNVNNPLTWEQSCAAGNFNGYATELGTNLVAAGLGHSVLRLGDEMNGVWESDFIGTRKTEQKLWAKCFANEVTGLRRAAGEHLLIDWNPNACVGNYPYANFYPGNAYVDILGLDLYDVGCETPTTPLTFSQLAREPAGLTRFEAFAAAKRKPMSLPEWGLSTIPSGDDPGYIDGIGSTIANGKFAFETYFEGGGKNVKAMALGASTPMSLAAFRQWFGNG